MALVLLRKCFAALSLITLPTVASAECVRSQLVYPGQSGDVNGIPVTVILRPTGTNGGASDAEAFWSSVGGNGTILKTLTIKAQGPGGDRMSAFFSNNLLYIENSIYLPGEAHCCNTNISVQTYSMDLTDKQHPTLRPKDLASLPQPKWPKMNYDKLCKPNEVNRELRDYLTGPYQQALINGVATENRR